MYKRKTIKSIDLFEIVANFVTNAIMCFYTKQYTVYLLRKAFPFDPVTDSLLCNFGRICTFQIVM